jgi:hypothetical protein
MGPAYTNFGKRVFYDRAIFEKFVAAGQVQTTGCINLNFQVLFSLIF